MISGPIPSPGITAMVLLMGKLLGLKRGSQREGYGRQAENSSIIADAAVVEQPETGLERWKSS
jgi:hypothetical protein